VKQTKRRALRTEADIRRLVAGYERGDQSRADYCAAHGMAVTTLDYYRRRYRRADTGLVAIDLRGETPAEAGGVAVVLGNGRRLEIEWAGLARVADHGQPLRALLALLEEA
jgi:transposase-like protein